MNEIRPGDRGVPRRITRFGEKGFTGSLREALLKAARPTETLE